MEIRRSYDHLISTMGFPILVRQNLYIESGPRTGPESLRCSWSPSRSNKHCSRTFAWIWTESSPVLAHNRTCLHVTGWSHRLMILFCRQLRPFQDVNCLHVSTAIDWLKTLTGQFMGISFTNSSDFAENIFKLCISLNDIFWILINIPLNVLRISQHWFR